MNVSEIVNIVLVALTLVVGFAATYFKANGKLNGKVAAYISEAEATYTDAKSGGVKMQYVVGKLYALLPAAIRPFIPQTILMTLAQTVFNKIADYATQQLDKAMDKVVPAYTGSVVGTVTDAPAAAVTSTGTAEASQTQQVTAGLGSGTNAK